MIKFLQGLLLAVAFLGPAAVQAQVPQSTAETLLRKSGLWEQLSDIAAQAQAAFAQEIAQSDGTPSETERARVVGVIGQAYAADRLRRAVADSVAQKLNPAHVAMLERWFDSPVGQAVTRLEEAASKDETDPQTLMAQGASLLAKLPAERRELLDQLLVASQAAEALTQIAINTAIAAQRGAASAMPSEPTVSEAEFQALLQAQRPQLLQMISGLSLAGFAKAYAELPQPQLQAYVAFMKSAAGSHFNTLCLAALDAALTDAANELGRRLPGTKDGANT